MTALAGSSSLPNINEFVCMDNDAWFCEDKESLIHLFIEAVQKMTSLESLYMGSTFVENQSH